MLNRLILWSLHNRMVVLALAVVMMGVGLHVASQTPLDIFPEFAPPQVVVQTEAAGFSAEEVEQGVTLPLETALNGTSTLVTIRSSSTVGLSVITCIFEAGTDIFRARQLVHEKVQLARARLPDGADEPQLMPLSSPIGFLLEISLTADQTSLMDLRTLADWTIRPRLLAVPGVSQVVVFGGDVKQYQVLVDPAQLKDYDVTLAQVMSAARRANHNAGAGFFDTPGQTMVIQGEGRIHALADLERAVITLKNHVPVTISQVATVRVGPEYKVGDASTVGTPSVLLQVFKQPWANTLTTTTAVEAALAGLHRALPSDVVMDAQLFRQATFIERAITNIAWALVQGGALVVLVLVLFLCSWRTAVISLTAIPLSLLVAGVLLHLVGASVNTMTLGGLAIAIGEVVDDAIIDVENVYRRLRENRGKAHPEPPLSVIYHASREVRGSIVYATVIVALVFVPIFALSGLAGRIFTPLAQAYILAILASLAVALTLTPALCACLLPAATAGADESVTVRVLKRHYARLLSPVLNHPRTVLALAALGLALALAAIPWLGGEFLPAFNEGNLVIHMVGVPGTALAESMRVGALVQRRVAQVPEVRTVAQRSGRAELSEDTIGPHYTEVDVDLRESDRRRAEVIAEVRQRLEGVLGFAFSIKQFIAERIEEVLSGTTATVVVKLFGPDLDVLQEKAAEIQGAMATLPGVVDLNVEQQTGVPKVLVAFRREALAQYGLTSADLAETMRAAFYGVKVAEVFEQQRAFALLVRYVPGQATDIRTLRATLIDTPTGAKVPLGALAEVHMVHGPQTINRENAQRRIVIACNIAGRSLTGVVAAIQQRVAAQVPLPTGYYLVYGGQYEAQARAVRDITLLGGAALVGIVVLLFLALRSIRQAVLVLTNLPLALIGGIAAVLIASAGETSVASLVGFISLFGIATRNGIMLITHYTHLMTEEGMPFGRELVVRGAMERLAPIVMTALTAGVGLLPLALSGGKPGRELEQPMAVVIVGGLVTSTLLNMVVLPTLYLQCGRPTRQEVQSMPVLPHDTGEQATNHEPQHKP